MLIRWVIDMAGNQLQGTSPWFWETSSHEKEKTRKGSGSALSSAEVGFRGIAKGFAKVLWLRKLLREHGFLPK